MDEFQKKCLNDEPDMVALLVDLCKAWILFIRENSDYTFIGKFVFLSPC